MGWDNPLYLGRGLRIAGAAKNRDACAKTLSDAGIADVEIVATRTDLWLILRPKRFMWAVVPCEDRCVWLDGRDHAKNIVVPYASYAQPAEDSQGYWYEWSDVRAAARRYKRRAKKRADVLATAARTIETAFPELGKFEESPGLVVWDHLSY
ncbi:hypothetical protein [Medusavirus stheno T3]|uniref:Uncharacterized protein n=1 Tax=Medusavirus stheno T3 TaxID=3069717 RepID=A0A7S8BDE4_9VIRU|nr:hypothetical protein QKU73_gp399 [Acanthamoeba castellanii medusavirus]QPB44376.1 hypothetical protein [Medusavirus stheno T3]